MTINNSDIKLKQSERLTDTDDGGGHMTEQEVIDGQVNNLFPDISRLDRTTGRVSLRKAFAHADTANQDTYYGAHLIVTKQPADPNVKIALFDTDSASDERLNAQNRIESYLVKGIASSWRLFGNHFAGQLSLSVLMSVDDPLPLIGESYVLAFDDEGTYTEEYVRVSDVSFEDRTFVTFEENAERRFTRRVVTLDLFQAIDSDWPGDNPSYFNKPGAGTKIHETVVADAARYYGMAALTDQLAAGDKTLSVDSIFAKIVPTTQEETALTDLLASAELSKPVEAGDQRVVTALIHSINNVDPSTVYYGRPITPGSLTVRVSTSSGNFVELKDDGAGNLTVESAAGSGTNSVAEASVDYTTGAITLQLSAWWGGNATCAITATPATVVQEANETASDEVTQGTRSFTWVWTLNPIPVPGALAVTFRSLGRWYSLRDNGRGKLAGASPAEGVGTVNYATGTVNVTLGYLPDTGSRIIRTWGSGMNVVKLTDHILAAGLSVTHSLNSTVIPSSLTITYKAGGLNRFLSDDGSGNLTGNGTGTVNYGSGKIEFTPDKVPDKGSNVTYDFETDTSAAHSSTPSASGSSLPISLGGAVEPKTVSLDLPVLVKQNGGEDVPGLLRIFDKADGNLSGKLYRDGTFRTIRTYDGTLGTVNHATGNVSVDLSAIEYSYNAFNRVGFWGNNYVTTTATYVDGSTVSGSYLPSGGTAVADSEVAPADELLLNLVGDFTGQAFSGGLLFTYGGKTYLDRNGTLYHSHNTETDAATAGGSVDYTTSVATLTDWSGGGDNQLVMLAGNGIYGAWTVDQVTFRAPVSTLKPASLTVQATTPSGSTSTATAAQNGAIAGGAITGDVDVDTGTVTLTFASPISPESITYSAVAIKFIPLSEELIGLDPIRLPSDGRVPIFRPADIVVIHHTTSEVMPNPLSAGQQVALNRNPISSLRVLAADGSAVPEDRYSADLDAGNIILADPLDKTGLPEPWTVEHRIEDMRLVSEPQIGGAIELLSPVSFTFPVGSKISTALPLGDLAARVSSLFTQKLWSNVWADARIGDDTAAKYNDIQYPVEVLNSHAVQERWAIHFTGSTTFQVIGESYGIIANGNTGSDLAPVNPLNGQPYFTLRAAGWGTGWASGNVLRFNTHASSHPMWLLRTVTSGTSVADEDSGRIEIRGDAE